MTTIPTTITHVTCDGQTRTFKFETQVVEEGIFRAVLPISWTNAARAAYPGLNNPKAHNNGLPLPVVGVHAETVDGSLSGIGFSSEARPVVFSDRLSSVRKIVRKIAERALEESDQKTETMIAYRFIKAGITSGYAFDVFLVARTTVRSVDGREEFTATKLCSPEAYAQWPELMEQLKENNTEFPEDLAIGVGYEFVPATPENARAFAAVLKAVRELGVSVSRFVANPTAGVASITGDIVERGMVMKFDADTPITAFAIAAREQSAQHRLAEKHGGPFRIGRSVLVVGHAVRRYVSCGSASVDINRPGGFTHMTPDIVCLGRDDGRFDCSYLKGSNVVVLDDVKAIREHYALAGTGLPDQISADQFYLACEVSVA